MDLWGSGLRSAAIVGVPSCLAPDLRVVQRWLYTSSVVRNMPDGMFSKP